MKAFPLGHYPSHACVQVRRARVLVPGVHSSHQPALEVWNLAPYQQPPVPHITLMRWGPYKSVARPWALDLVALSATIETFHLDRCGSGGAFPTTSLSCYPLRRFQSHGLSDHRRSRKPSIRQLACTLATGDSFAGLLLCRVPASSGGSEDPCLGPDGSGGGLQILNTPCPKWGLPFDCCSGQRSWRMPECPKAREGAFMEVRSPRGKVHILGPCSASVSYVK